MPVRLRFAPSPTGRLHVGNLRTALYNWLYARKKSGVFILRIEDTDVDRSERRYEEHLLDDLRWMGLDWDEGPDVGGPHGPYRQSDRAHLYREHAERLLSDGKAYRCFCSPALLEEDRKQQMASGQQPHYLGRCRDLSPQTARQRLQDGEAATLRLRVRSGKVGFEDQVFGSISVDCSTIGDFILLRSDGSAQYNFAVVVDDTQMQISHIVRGEGHISNTHRQILIYEALGLEAPCFAHLSTILGKDGSKLSKRHSATSLDAFRSQGYLPQAVVNYLALLGWSPPEGGKEIFQPAELVQTFDLHRVHRSPATFDPDKLDWVNRSHLKLLEPDRLASLIHPHLQAAGWLPPSLDDAAREWLAQVAAAILKYLDRLDQSAEQCQLIFDFVPGRDLQQQEVAQILAEDGAWEVIEILGKEISGSGELRLGDYKQAVQAVKAASGKKGKHLFHPIRVALTGRASGLELDKLVPILEAGKGLNLPATVMGVRERIRAVLERKEAGNR
ncbi:MAG: glutamate--tRNA ligase [Acidobacteriota bacterium]